MPVLRDDMKVPKRFAGIELGGTKSIAVLADQTNILDRVVIPTTSPIPTLAHLHATLAAWHRAQPVTALGIASFGPIRLNHLADDFGTILATPKAGWSGAAVAGHLTDRLDIPWRIDTDVNGAALAEYHWGAAGKDCDVLSYITIGTGLGGGFIVNGRTLTGALHPEIGHLRLRRVPNDDFGGICPFHGDCIEGLVSGPALAARFDADPKHVPDDDPRWQYVAADIAELCGSILLTTSARTILFGGGVATARPLLLTLVRERVVSSLSGYLPFLDTESALTIIRPASLGTLAGPLGTIALAYSAIGLTPTVHAPHAIT